MYQVPGLCCFWLLQAEGSGHQGLPTLPKHIMLFRARGVEEVEVVESGEGESSSEADDDVNCEGDL